MNYLIRCYGPDDFDIQHTGRPAEPNTDVYANLKDAKEALANRLYATQRAYQNAIRAVRAMRREDVSQP